MVESLMETIDVRTEAHNQALHERGGRTGAEIEEEKNEDWMGRNKNSMDLGRALGGREWRSWRRGELGRQPTREADLFCCLSGFLKQHY
jgi:hypothetical protein